MEYIQVKNGNTVNCYHFETTINNEYLAKLLSCTEGKKALIRALQTDLDNPWYNLHFDICKDVRTI